jgi:hypothetical protein
MNGNEPDFVALALDLEMHHTLTALDVLADTILFVVVHERRRGRVSDFTHNFNYEMENELPRI